MQDGKEAQTTKVGGRIKVHSHNLRISRIYDICVNLCLFQKLFLSVSQTSILLLWPPGRPPPQPSRLRAVGATPPVMAPGGDPPRSSIFAMAPWQVPVPMSALTLEKLLSTTHRIHSDSILSIVFFECICQ